MNPKNLKNAFQMRNQMKQIQTHAKTTRTHTKTIRNKKHTIMWTSTTIKKLHIWNAKFENKYAHVWKSMSIVQESKQIYEHIQHIQTSTNNY